MNDSRVRASSNVTVSSPGVLNGTGTINGNVNGNGTFSPGIGSGFGAVLGILTINGLTLRNTRNITFAGSSITVANGTPLVMQENAQADGL